VIVVVVLVLVACTSPAGGPVTTTTAPASTTTQASTTTTTTTIAPTTTTTIPPEAAIITDGVTVTDDTIYIGLLADLTGPFSGNVVDLVDAQLAFWSKLNDEGGIAGRSVELLISDTGYDPVRHQELYRELRDKVVFFSHSTGSPHTAAIAGELVADDRLALAVSWYSGWADPAFGANVLETGSNYCVEAMNAISYLAAAHEQATGEKPTIAIATDAGDYGQDSAAGARYAAEALGLRIAYDGEAEIQFGLGNAAVAQAIARSRADWTWLATDPISVAEILSGALSQGYAGAWSGAMPSFSPRLLDTALGEYLSQAWVLSVLFAPVGADVAGMDEVYAVLAEAFPGRYPADGLIRGYLEYSVTRQILERAAALGDLTPPGVLAAARELETLFFDGISPANNYGDTLDQSVARATALYKPDKAMFDAQGGLEANFAAGAVAPYQEIQGFFVSDIAADYEFTAPCYQYGQ
jgi:ABC-type branched-subunit amino acid transport system substrate-binding protein